MKEWILPTILTILAWSFWAFLPKIATRYIDPYSATVYQSLGGILVGLGALIAIKFQVEFNTPGFSYSLVAGLLGFFGAFTYLLAVSKGPQALVAPLTALYPMLVIILSFVFLHEAVSIRQGIGIALSLAAIFLIST